MSGDRAVGHLGREAGERRQRQAPFEAGVLPKDKGRAGRGAKGLRPARRPRLLFPHCGGWGGEAGGCSWIT